MESRNNGFKGNNKFDLPLANYHFCQYKKMKRNDFNGQYWISVKSGLPLLIDPLKRGVTVVAKE